MIERINDLAARRFGGIGTTVGSLVRIHLWALVFLVAISLVLPARSAPLRHPSRDPSVRSVDIGFNDPRAFAPSVFGEDRYRIEWISGSEGAVNFKPLANLVLPHFSAIDGRKIGVDVYLQPANRITDIYFEVLHAIASKPDMIVISLNPAFALYPLATHEWKELDFNAAVQLLSRPSGWPVAASVLSPADLMWGLAGSEFPAVRDRSDYGARIHDVVDDLGPLDRSGLQAASKARKRDLTQRVLTMATDAFWSEYRLHEPFRNTPDGWAHVLATSNRGQSELNKIVMRAIAAALRDSKIPSFVYLAPVNSRWFSTNPRLASAVAGIEAQLERLRGDFTARNILYQPLTLTRLLPKMQFWGLVHLRRAPLLGPYLAAQLCRLVTQVGQAATCDMPKGGSG